MRRPRKDWAKINAFDGQVRRGAGAVTVACYLDAHAQPECATLTLLALHHVPLRELQILRFFSKFAKPTNVVDIDREFTVSFFLSSDSIAIYEPPKKNSGVLGGKFLAKTRLRNPDSGLYYVA